jgi:IPT/TIG domain
MNSPRVTRSPLLISAAVSVLVLLIGSVVAVAGSTRPASAAAVDYLITPTGFDFGDVPMNDPSPAQQVRVTNISGATIMPILTGGNAGVFGGTDRCSHRKLPNRGSCTLSYQFTPTGTGPRATTISPSLNGQAFTLSFQGNGINPFRITPTSLDFGNVGNFGHSATQTVTITNTGTVTEPTDTSGLDAGVFGGTSDCPASLTQGASCHLVFEFSPTTIGTQSAIATGVVDFQQYAINLTGRSYKGIKPTTPALLITPTALDFGDVPLGNVADLGEQPVTFTNVSSATITPGQLNISGEFAASAGCTDALAPGASCTDEFLYEAETTGHQNTTVTGTWGGQAISISLTGNGIRDFLITPTSFDFGNVPDGSQSAPQSVVVQDVGGSGTTLTGPATADSENFPDNDGCQGASLMNGQTCYMSFSFVPSGPDPYSFNTDSNWNGQEYNLSFKGVGTPVIPAVTSISPSSGPKAGGTVVTVTGYGFTGVTEVLFGSTPGTNVSSDADEQLHVTAPAHGTGAFNIHVVTSLGTSPAVTADLYNFLPVPTVTAVSPTSGPKAGGTTVTVTGTGFTGATQVLFGNTPGTALSVTSDTNLTIKSPAHALGLAHVHVITPGGRSAAVAADEYTYQPLPTVTAISPTSGPHAGGTTVSVTGTGFTGATQVLFGSTPGTNLTVTTDTHLTVRSPSHATGPFNVHVVTPSGGESAAVSADLYTYN